MVSELLEVEILPDAGAERRDQRGDLVGGDDFVDARALDVEDLAFQRQDRLEFAIAALLGGSTGRVTLDQVELAEARIALLAIGKLPRKPAAVEHTLAARKFARLARGFASTRRV